MFLQINYRAESKLIDLSDEELYDDKLFIAKILDEFKINDRVGRKLVFLTGSGAIVPPHQFIDVVKQFIGCACFSMKMVFTDDKEPSSETALRLKAYIVEAEGDEDLFVEESEGALSPRGQEKVYKHVFEFLLKEYTATAKLRDVLNVCKATVELFNSLKTNDSEIGVIDLLYDVKNRKGVIYQKMVYKKRKRTEHAGKSSGPNPKRAKSKSNGGYNGASVAEDAETFISLIQTITLPQGEASLKKKFEETVQLRRTMDLDKYKPLFDVYLMCPNLILFDYRLRFDADNKQNDLSSLWLAIQSNLVLVFGQKQIEDDFKKYKRNGDIKTFVKLLKVLPTHQKRFKTALNSALIISEDTNIDPMLLMTQKDHPVMIAIQSKTDSNEIKFYIEVKNHLICIPTNTSFVAVLDMYYKVHKVFNVDFGSNFLQLMVFLDRYIYGNCDQKYKPSNSTERVAKQLLNI